MRVSLWYPPTPTGSVYETTIPDTRVEIAWSAAVDALRDLSTKIYDRKSAVPLLAFGDFESAKTTDLKDGIWAFSWDLDGADHRGEDPERFERFLASVKSQWATGLAFATFSCGDARECDLDRVKARVIVPFDGPLGVAAWPSVWAALTRVALAAGVANDAQTANVARRWHVPATNARAASWAKPCWFESWG